jgi:hypothetical protein
MKNWASKFLPGLLILGGLVAAQSKPGCASTVEALEQRMEAQRWLLTDWAGLIRF